MNNINYGKSILLKMNFIPNTKKLLKILKNIEKQYCHYVQLRILFQNFLKCHCHMAYRKDIY